MYTIWYTLIFEIMKIVTAREFRENQRESFEKVDNGEHVVITRGQKSYLLTPLSRDEKILLSPETVARIKESIEQANKGEVLKIKQAEIDDFLGI